MGLTVDAKQDKTVILKDLGNKFQSSHGTQNLKRISSKKKKFVASFVDIANTLESRLRSEILKRHEQKTLEVKDLQDEKFNICTFFALIK